MSKDELNRRDGLAEDRTVLANERTYAAWVRTGLTALAAWVAVEKLMVELIPAWSVHVIGISLLVFALSSFGLGFWRYHRTSMRLRSAFVPIFPSLLLAALTALLLIAVLTAIGSRLLG